MVLMILNILVWDGVIVYNNKYNTTRKNIFPNINTIGLSYYVNTYKHVINRRKHIGYLT